MPILTNKLANLFLLMFIVWSCKNEHKISQSINIENAESCDKFEESIELIRTRQAVLDTLIHYFKNPELDYNRGHLAKDISGNTLGFSNDIRLSRELIVKHPECPNLRSLTSLIDINFESLKQLWIGRENELYYIYDEIETFKEAAAKLN